MSRLRPCPAPRELHINDSHAIAAAGNDDDDGKHDNSHDNPQASWVPWILVRTQVPLTSCLPFLDFGSLLAFPYTPGFLVRLYQGPYRGFSGESLHCCAPRWAMSCVTTPGGSVLVNSPVSRWEAGLSSQSPVCPAAYLHPAPPTSDSLLPSSSYLPHCTARVQNPHLALAGCQGLTYLDLKKMPDERKRPNVEYPCTPTCLLLFLVSLLLLSLSSLFLL